MFLVAWIRPQAIGRPIIPELTLIMLLEFIIVHSSAFMGHVGLKPGNARNRVSALFGLGLFYSVFVGGFALAFKSWWPLVSFWGLTVNRMLGLLLGQAPPAERQSFLQRGWAASACFYLLGCFATVLLPIPRLGVTTSVLLGQRAPGDGLWIDQPWRLLAFGAFYFIATGLSELSDHRWLGTAKQRPAGNPDL